MKDSVLAAAVTAVYLLVFVVLLGGMIWVGGHYPWTLWAVAGVLGPFFIYSLYMDVKNSLK